MGIPKIDEEMNIKEMCWAFIMLPIAGVSIWILVGFCIITKTLVTIADFSLSFKAMRSRRR